MPFGKFSRSDFFVLVLFFLILLASIFYFRQARHFIGKDFPGFLTYENKIVGAFNQFEWNGAAQELKNHDFIKDQSKAPLYEVIQNGKSKEFLIQSQIFSLGDFLKVFCLPFFSGLFFLILAFLIYTMMWGMPGALLFFLFNAGVAYFFIASFDFHTSYHLSWLFLLNFSLMPAAMTTFALVYPESPASISKHKFVLALPYLTTAFLAIPYIAFFYAKPLVWPFWEAAIVVYASLSYLFWMIRLAQVSNHPQHEMSRVIAKYLLGGQMFAFIIPLVLAAIIFIFHKNIPLNWATPTTLIFPIAALFGMTLGKLKRTQMELVQSEKMASLGQLLAGVAHEINNPTTFIYSNIGPLKEYLAYLKPNLIKNSQHFRNEMTMEEVFSDLESLVNNIEEGANRTKQIVSDLRHFGHSQDNFVTEVNIREGIQGTLNILKHTWDGKIDIQLDCPPDLTVKANPGELSQLWMNLLANSIQSIEKKGTIWVTAKEEGNTMRVSIKDNGHGIKPEHLHKIFDPFFTTKDQGLGTGLGLSIVQQIVKKWRGKLLVKSEVGKGTEFVVVFPKL